MTRALEDALERFAQRRPVTPDEVLRLRRARLIDADPAAPLFPLLTRKGLVAYMKGTERNGPTAKGRRMP